MAMHVPWEILEDILRIRSRLMRLNRWQSSASLLTIKLRFPRLIGGPTQGEGVFHFDLHQSSRKQGHYWSRYETQSLSHTYFPVDPRLQQAIVSYYDVNNVLGIYVKQVDGWNRIDRLPLWLAPNQLLDKGEVAYENDMPDLNARVRVIAQPLPIPYALAEHAHNVSKEVRECIADNKWRKIRRR